MPKSVLTRARQLFRRRKFSQVIRLLESQIFRYRNHAEFYALLGSACLHTGDFGGAESYLRRAEQLNEDHLDTQLGLAAVAFKRSQVEDALKHWLKVVDLDPGNRKARGALDALRKDASWEGSAVNTAAIKIKNVLPSLPVSPWAWVAPLLLVCAASALILAYIFLLPRIAPRRPPRPGVEEIVLSLEQPLSVQTAGSQTAGPQTAGPQTTGPQTTGPQTAEPRPAFTLSDQEIEGAFETIKGYLLEYRDNLALREINTLLHSNASVYVKEKARLMKTFVEDPDFSTIKDPFPFLQVRSNPLLYEDCYVVWKGKAANVLVGEDRITFDLLVGYEDETELLGLVPVTMRFAASVENGDGIEVLGKVRIESDQLHLEAISIHRLYRKG